MLVFLFVCCAFGFVEFVCSPGCLLIIFVGCCACAIVEFSCSLPCSDVGPGPVCGARREEASGVRRRCADVGMSKGSPGNAPQVLSDERGARAFIHKSASGRRFGNGVVFLC